MSTAEPDDVVSFENDKRLDGLPRELERRRSGSPPRPPALWAARETYDEEGEWGAYPKGFVPWACRLLGVQASEVLHLCSGGMRKGQGTRLDIRSETRPDVVADARRLPFASCSVSAVLIDPPYSREYARDLYHTDYPRPSHLLSESARVLKPACAVGILHFLVPMVPKTSGLCMERVIGVTIGAGYRIRAFSVFRKEQAGLFA